MPDEQVYRVFDDEGLVGQLMPAGRGNPGAPKRIRLEDGREIEVNAGDLKARPDGSFQLRQSAAPPSAAPAPVSRAETRISEPAQATVPRDAFYEHGYDIERVPIDRVVDGPIAQRQEGDTLVLPVLEEVLVWEKKMILKEEIRITPQRRAVPQVRRIGIEGSEPAASNRETDGLSRR